MSNEKIITDVNEFLMLTQPRMIGDGWQDTRKQARLKSGLTMSIQASNGHYSTPRAIGNIRYGAVEVGYPSEEVPELMEYAESPDKPTETIYGWVPVDVLNGVIVRNGGIILP